MDAINPSFGLEGHHQSKQDTKSNHQLLVSIAQLHSLTGDATQLSFRQQTHTPASHTERRWVKLSLSIFCQGIIDQQKGHMENLSERDPAAWKKNLDRQRSARK